MKDKRLKKRIISKLIFFYGNYYRELSENVTSIYPHFWAHRLKTDLIEDILLIVEGKPPKVKINDENRKGFFEWLEN